MPKKTEHDCIIEVAKAVRNAWYSNRTIVPVVGSGLSADSGFPVLRSVVRYLAKLYEYIERGSPFAMINFAEAPSVNKKVGDRYRRQTWNYVMDFGWPDRFQLNQDLFRIGGNATVSDTVAGVLTKLTPEINPAGKYPFRELQKAIEQIVINDSAIKEKVTERFKTDQGRSVPYEVFGDWRRLIQHITKFQPDQADSLFATLGQNKSPNQGHRYLTFLIRLLSVRTVFTFNFDDLIERALEAEGLRPKVFAMEEGRNLPHKSLAGDPVSVVKLHGSTHALLLDERLDRPLTEEYLDRFDRLVGRDPLLLVIGCSGGDRRLISLVDHVLFGAKAKERRVAWLHFESYRPSFLKLNPDDDHDPSLRKGVLGAQTSQPASSLTHIYSFLTSRYPASSKPYTAGAGQTLGYSRLEAEDRVKLKPLFEGVNKVFLLASIDLAKIDENVNSEDFPRTTAAEALFDVADFGLNHGYIPIIVNLESVHTLGALVGAIVDHCRQHDSALAPSVLPSDEWTDAQAKMVLAKAVALVANALQRSRYLVLLEGIETFLWNATSHHGETNVPPDRLSDQFELLCQFLVQMNEAQGPAGDRPKVNDIGESRIVASIDARTVRNEIHPGTGVKLGSLFAKTKFDKLRRLELSTSTQKFDQVFKTIGENVPFQTFLIQSEEHCRRNAAVLLLLTSCRRARPLALVRHLLRPLFDSAGEIDQWLADRTAPQRNCGFTMLVGGVTWMSLPVRNYVYAKNTAYTSTRVMKEILTENKSDDLKKCVAQLLISYMFHYRLTRTYYVYTFGQSNDALAFLEYTYHRISTLRYLTKLIAVLEWACSQGKTQDVRDAMKAVGGFLKGAAGEGYLEKEKAEKRYLDLIRRLQVRSGKTLEEAINGWEITGGVAALVAELKERHCKESHAVLRAWYRHEPLLRLQLPAQQLLHWCERLVEDDLEYRCDKVVYDYQNNMPCTYPKGRDLVRPDAIKKLSTLISDLRVKLWAERGDYDRVLRQRHNQLGGERLPEPPYAADQLQIAVERIGDQLEGDNAHYVLDIINALIKRWQCDQLPEARDLANTLLEKVKKIPKAGGTENERRCHEISLRYHHLKSEFELGSISVFAGGFCEVPVAPSDTPSIDLVLDTVDDGMEENRLQLAVSDDLPRSVVIDRTADGTLYPQYRTVFDTLRARRTWIQTLCILPNKDSQYWSKPFDEDYREQFQPAFRYFELAKGGLEGTNPLLLSLVEIYEAEACLGIARFHLHRAHKSLEMGAGSGRVDSLIAQAKAKHASSRGCLLRSREHLLETRRNVVWWKLFFTLVAQYHSDRLTLLLLELHLKYRRRAPGADALSSEYLSRLRKGYNALRHAAEFRISPAHTDVWLCRIWGEITLAGAGLAYGAASVLVAHFKASDRIDKGIKIGLVIDLLSQIHELERLLPEAASGWNHDVRSAKVTKEVVNLLNLYDADQINSFEFRSSLMQQATILSS